jgi:endonuclease/exonuclease/phosphatase family metal-dependent hydrolase
MYHLLKSFIMKNIYYLPILIMIFIVSSSQAQKNIDFGTDTTFEVATWNLEHFPKNGQITVDYVSLFVGEMSIDLFALQEIESQSSFNSLVADLDEYDGYWAYDQYAPLAIIYKSNTVELNNTYRILASYPREFPRAPLVAEITVRGDSYVIIVNHYKCCGDGIMDLNDDWDEETRRYDASVLLKDYIDTHYADDRVIMLGDFNDEILDDEANNVFEPFLDAPDDFAFADMSIAQSSAANWSYPSWPSHLDHILVTNEVFEEFLDGVPDVLCLKPDEYLPGGWGINLHQPA